MKPPRPTILGALLCAFAAYLPVSPSTAEPPPPPPPRPPGPKKSPFMRELSQLRDQFSQRALAAGRTLSEQYANALGTLETQAVEAGDYETALAAQQRRQELAALYEHSEPDPAPAIILRPGDAKTVGAITFDQTENALVNWRTAGSSATWDVFKITPGTYTVGIICGVAESLAGGDVEFSEVTSLSGTESTKLAATLKSTGGWTSFELVRLGDLKLGRTSARLTLKATRIAGTGGVMHLKQVRLTHTHSLATSTPVEPEPAAAPAKPGPDDLEQLRATHRTRLHDLAQPVLNAYLAKLTAISDQLIAARDEDGAQAVVTEQKLAAQSLERPETAARPAPGRIVYEGLEEIRDVTYVDDPTNTGDRFLVSANGEKISVRLMSVTCPPPNPEDKESLAFCAAYFGISTEDCITVGREAQEFTATYLKDRPLRLLTRRQKDRGGSIAAVVLPAEVGVFAGILVDNGLAAINDVVPRGNRSQENIRAALKEREAAARSKTVPPGAWSFAGQSKTAP